MSSCSGNGSCGKVEIEEVDGSCSRQKEYNFIVFVHGDIRPRSGAFHHGYSILGRRSLAWEMVSRAKRSVDEAGSRRSDVEAGERACRSSDV